MDIGLEHLRVFRVVAEERSFTRAAEKLHRTQPGISQIIRALEETLGESLLERRGRTSSLTQAGQVLLAHARDVFDRIDQAVVQIQGLRNLQAGRLTVSTSDTTALYVLPAILREFRVLYPGVELRIQSKPSPVSVKQVADREVDLGIVTLPVGQPGIVSEPFMVREDVVICHPEHALAVADSVTLDDLGRHSLMLLDHGSNTRSFIDQQFLSAGIVPDIIMELGNIEVIKKLVQLNFGVSIVPLIAVEEEVKRKSLVAIRVFKKEQCRRLGLIYLANRPHCPAARVFIEMVKQAFSGHDV